jgi:hypothetical protein
MLRVSSPELMAIPGEVKSRVELGSTPAAGLPIFH